MARETPREVGRRLPDIGSITKKRLPLPRRLNVALSDQACARLRALNASYGLGNNHLLTILLERLHAFADSGKLEAALKDFIAEYGAPPVDARRH